MMSEGPTSKQRALVALLTSGNRMSLRRAWQGAGYDWSHNVSLDQLLNSPTTVALFREAIEAGRLLPMKYADRIMAAIAAQDAEALA